MGDLFSFFVPKKFITPKQREPFSWAWRLGVGSNKWILDIDLPATDRGAIIDAGGVVVPLYTLEQIESKEIANA